MKHLVLTFLLLSIFFPGLTQVSSSLDYSIPAPSTSSAPSNPFLNNIGTRNMSLASDVAQRDYKHISPEDAYKRINNGENIVLLDVRTLEEFAARRIPGSILIPIEPVDMVSKDVERIILDKNIPVFIYCRSGRRSVDAAKVLVKIGYTDVYDLGGINSWPYETISTNTR